MKKKRNWLARLVALAALVAAVIVVIVVASNTDLNSGPDRQGAHPARAHKQKQPKKARTKAKTYTVKSGDTLTSIAQRTGVTVAELQALNPEVDPQILVAGEVLKLRK